MSKSIRIRTTPNGDDKFLKVNLEQDFDFIEILSLKISQEDIYRNFCSDYGVVIGRVNINNGFGVPNAKVSIFVPISDEDKLDPEVFDLYPYEITTDTNGEGIRYNLLPNTSQVKDECFTPVGTFPTKREILDNDELGEIYQKYYKFTTTTNQSGDFMFFGIPIGQYFIHADADVSDIGIVSSKPYDFIRQGVNEKKFETPNKFKGGKQLNRLVQVKTASPIGTTVRPFWGDGETCDIGITRVDIDLNETVTPHAIFMGSVIGDGDKNAINKRCRAQRDTGKLEELITRSGRIEMIRKTPDGGTERFDVEGGQVIDDDGVWSYQIPMNDNYMITNEEGELVPSNNPAKGIPTTSKVRFRVSMLDTDPLGRVRARGQYLVPNNPDNYSDSDYNFDESTPNDQFADLSFNKVYSVKNFIPRYDNSPQINAKSGIMLKDVANNVPGYNNIPYNKMDIDFNPIFTILCFLINLIVTVLVFIFNAILLTILNSVIYTINLIIGTIICVIQYQIAKIINLIRFNTNNKDGTGGTRRCAWCLGDTTCEDSDGNTIVLDSDECRDDLDDDENNEVSNCSKKVKCKCLGAEIIPYIPYIVLTCNEQCYAPFAFVRVPNVNPTVKANKKCSTIQWPDGVTDSDENNDPNPPDGDSDGADAGYLDCVTSQLAEAFNIYQFLFYNDWLNGTLYFPLFKTKVRKRGTGREKFCEYDCSRYTAYNGYSGVDNDNDGPDNDCNKNFLVEASVCTCNPDGSDEKGIGVGCSKNNTKEIRDGIIKKYNDTFYYASVTHDDGFPLFKTDVISLGSILECDWEGQPQIIKYLVDTSYRLPGILDLEDESGNNIESGIDSFENGKALFAKVTCVGADTTPTRATNIRRYCELGVGPDEDRTDENPNLGAPDFYINDRDVEAPELRNIFAWINDTTLGGGSLSSVNVGFGTGQPNCTNTGLADYNQFRYGNASVDSSNTGILGDYRRIKNIDNSFFFYFGLNVGKTALSKTLNKYFVPCQIDTKNEFNVFGSVTNNTAIGSCNGAINLTIDGGEAPFEFSWSNGDVTEDISNLCEGTYTVEVLDSNNNLVTQTFVVGGPAPLGFSLDAIDETSFNANDGYLKVSFIGGGNGGPYTLGVVGSSLTTGYTVNTGDVEEFFNLESGTYTVTLTDGVSTPYVDSIFIDQPPQLTLSVDTTDNLCNGSSEAFIDLTINGGALPYSYNITGPFGFSSSNLNNPNLVSGVYNVSVTDNIGDNISTAVTISNLSTALIDIAKLDVGCMGNNDGILTVTANGTDPNFTVKKDGSTIGTITTIGGILTANTVAGTFELSVTNSNGCSASDTIIVNEPANELLVGINIHNTVVDLVDGTHVCYNANNYTIRPTVSGGWGDLNYFWEYYNADTFMWVQFSTTVGDVNFRPWDYNGGDNDSVNIRLRVVDSDGNTSHADCEVIDSLNLIAGYVESVNTITTTVTDVGCNGSSDGVIRVSAVGVPQFSVELDNVNYGTIPVNGGFLEIPSLAVDTYTLEVTNGDGCVYTENVVVAEPVAISGGISIGSTTPITVDAIDPCGDSDQFVVNNSVTNGWGDFSYQWQYKLSTSSVWNDVVGETSASITFLPWAFNGNTNNNVDLRLVVTDSGAGHQDCVYETAFLTLNPNLTSYNC